MSPGSNCGQATASAAISLCISGAWFHIADDMAIGSFTASLSARLDTGASGPSWHRAHPLSRNIEAPRYDLQLLAPQLLGRVATEVAPGPELPFSPGGQPPGAP